MAVFNLGSINADNFYRVAQLPKAGETIAASDLTQGLGGKGANMSVAAVRAGASVVHIGAVGADGEWAARRLGGYGVDVEHVAVVDTPTGHANICVDPNGENEIVLFRGANHALSSDQISNALKRVVAGDWLVLQNETNAQVVAASAAKSLGLSVLYAAAPFDATAVRDVLQYVDLLVLNEVEAEQLEAFMACGIGQLNVPNIVVTQGAQGCLWIGLDDRNGVQFGAHKVTAVDTTGAGDTFTGYLVAALDRGMEMAQAIDLAGRAAAIMVTRIGTADVIPALAEITT